MGCRMQINQQLLHDLFDYEYGELFWKKSIRTGWNGKCVGSLKPSKYKQVQIGKKMYLVHRLIFLYHHGYLPETIDHIDNNRLNNSIENLREATKSQNAINRKLVNSSSGIKGVSWKKRDKKWIVRLQINGIRKEFGSYNDIDYAKFVADAMRYKYHGEYANAGK